ncbi:MAG: CPBP family intramembrane metalloprotease [Candidatus Bathyarchaeota archaeon]|nr:CPBP family intramembrane metalloprotease [Candidatus Bathyarchaeota archaeon]
MKPIKSDLHMFSDIKPLPKKRYIAGVIAIFAAVYSQYFLPLGAVLGYLVVYGVPIAVVTLLFGKPLLERAAKNNKTAAKLGLGLFGALTVVGLFFSVLILAVMLIFDPEVINVLQQPNPVLDVSPTAAWVLIAVSLLVIGPAEEYLFRGFMYGGLLSISKGRYWFPLALLSSFLFAVVHAYYAVTYGAASIIQFVTLICFGIAMAITYYWSKGNILIPALLHGLYDAAGFLGVATTNEIGLAARLVLIAVGVVFAAVYLPKKLKLKIFGSEPAKEPSSL